MLPDYPKVKALITEAFQERIEMVRERQLGVFSNVKGIQMHEGSSVDLTRNDNSTENLGMMHIEATAEIRHDHQETDDFGFDDIMKMANMLGERLGAEQIRAFVETMDDAVRKVGNVGDPSKPFLDQYFEVLEKAFIDFTPDGQPAPRQMVAGSEKTAEKVIEAFQRIEADSVLRERHTEIMERKKQEWHDREAARNLVE